MASKRSVERECNRRNEDRNVIEKRSNDMDKFWASANGGSFLITDGSAEERERALLSKIEDCIYEENMPAIILNTSSEFEKKLISRVVGLDDKEVQLHVISPEYKYYHVFYGMKHDIIVDYLYDMASKTLDSVETGLKNYMNAFLYILESCCTPTLTDMLGLMEYNDSQIKEMGARNGVSKKELDALIKYADCGETFRNLVQDLANAFGVITTTDCDTEHSILGTELTDKTVFLITIRSGKPYLLNHYFALALRQLMETKSFRLIVNGLPFQEEDGLKELLNDLYDLPNMEIGICMQDVLSVLTEENEVRRIPTQVIFTGQSGVGSVPSVILDYLGQYDYFYPVKGGGKKDPFDFWASDSWSVGGPSKRNRVRTEDMNGYSVILKGTAGQQLLLVRQF